MSSLEEELFYKSKIFPLKRMMSNKYKWKNDAFKYM